MRGYVVVEKEAAARSGLAMRLAPPVDLMPTLGWFTRAWARLRMAGHKNGGAT